MTLFFAQVDFNNLSYIWMDIVIGIPYSILLGNLLSKRKIDKILPPNSLLTYNTLLSFVIHLIYAAILVIFSSRSVRYFPNYQTPNQIEKENNVQTEGRTDKVDLPYFETTVKFIFFLNLRHFIS